MRNYLPKNWNDVTIRQFQNIYPIVISEDYDNNFDKYIDIAAILLNSSIKDLPIEQINKLSFLLDISTIPDKRPTHIQFKGKLYKPIYEINKLTGGQYIDLSTYTANKDTVIKYLHYIIAIMCEERIFYLFKTKYIPENVKERADIFLDLPISVAYPMAVFFCKFSDSLIHSMADYLQKLTKTKM